MHGGRLQCGVRRERRATGASATIATCRQAYFAAAQQAPANRFAYMKSQVKRVFPLLASLLALSFAACATQPPPPPDIPPPPMRKLDAKTQLETGRTY
jgi:hypothetical protein